MSIFVYHERLRNHAHNTINPAISLVAYNVIPLLIGASTRALIISSMYHMGEGTRPCQFPVTGNGHGRDYEPKGNQFSVFKMGIIPEVLTLLGSQSCLRTFSAFRCSCTTRYTRNENKDQERSHRSFPPCSWRDMDVVISSPLSCPA